MLAALPATLLRLIVIKDTATATRLLAVFGVSLGTAGLQLRIGSSRESDRETDCK